MTEAPKLLFKIAACKLGGSEEREVLIDLDEGLYFFTGGALSQHVIRAPWSRRTDFRDRVYVRTPTEIFLTYYHSVGPLSERLDPARFLQLHQSLIVNAHKITAVEWRGRLKQVSVAPATGPAEWLTISRRYVNEVRLCFGLPSRG
jgi:hypothetical protein